MKFERQYNFAYFCNLSVSTNKGTFILKNNMPDTIQFHIWYQKAKYPKTYIRAWCILQNGSTWSQIVENSVEIWFNNIMFFAKVSTPTISWRKKLFGFFGKWYDWGQTQQKCASKVDHFWKILTTYYTHTPWLSKKGNAMQVFWMHSFSKSRKKVDLRQNFTSKLWWWRYLHTYVKYDSKIIRIICARWKIQNTHLLLL